MRSLNQPRNFPHYQHFSKIFQQNSYHMKLKGSQSYKKMSLSCEWCGTVASTKYNLVRHQKTALYCIEKQHMDEKIKEEVKIETEEYNCEFCQKEFTRKYDLNRHQNTCKNKTKFKNENERLIDENERLKFDIQSLQLKDRELTTENKCLREQVFELKAQLAEERKSQKGHHTYCYISTSNQCP